MASTIGLVAGFVLIALLDLPGLLKNKRKKELSVYTVLLVTAYLLFQLHFLHIELWGLNQLISNAVNFFTR